MKICPHCGNTIKNDLAKFCGKCGTKQPEIAPVIEPEQEPETLSVEDEDFVEAEQLSVATPPPFFEGEGMSAPPPIPAVEDVSCTTPPPVPSELLEQAEYASQDMNGETEFDEEEDIYSSAQYEEEKKLGCGAIAGIILGVLVAVIFIVVTIVYFKNNSDDDYSHDSDLYSVVDTTAVESVATYTYEEVDREREREQIVERRIYDRLQAYYTDMSNWSESLNILSKDFRNLLDRADNAAYPYQEMGFLDFNFWTEAQDHGNLTVLPFDSFSLDGNVAHVTVKIDDSHFGRINKRFEFVYEYGDWFVNDVTVDGSSLRSAAERCLADPEAWFCY